MRRYKQLDSPKNYLLFVCIYGSMPSTRMSKVMVITWIFYIIKKKIDLTERNIYI